VSPEGGEPIQVTKSGGFMPVESPDGRYLYYMRQSVSGPLYRMPTATGPENRVLEKIAARGYAVTDQGIYFTELPQSGPMSEYYEVNAHNTLLFFSFATGTSHVVAQLEKPLQLGLTLSPDGRWILYSQIDQLVEDLMLVEGFR